jgi:MFS family permease
MRLLSRDDADAPPAPPDGQARASAFSLLADPDYRAYWLATIPWNFSRWMEMVLSGWLMLELTNSPWQVALLGVFRTAAMPALALVAGVIADRVDRLRLILWAQVVNTAVPAATALLLVTGHLAPWHLFAGSLLFGLSWAFDWPTRRALMVDIVGPPRLVPANMLENLSMNLNRIAGPATGGIVLALTGPLTSYAVLALISAVGGLLLLPIRRPTYERTALTGSPLTNVIEGLTYVTRRQAILGALLVTVFMNLFVFPYSQLLPVVARDSLHVGPVELGWLGAAHGIGALVGLPLIAALRGRGTHGWIFLIGSAGMATLLAAFALCPWYLPALLLLVVGGIGHAGFGTMQSTIILSQTPPEMRWRWACWPRRGAPRPPSPSVAWRRPSPSR